MGTQRKTTTFRKLLLLLFKFVIMGDWEDGLFVCFSDFKVLIFLYFIPCFVIGKYMEKVDGGGCVVHAIKWSICPLLFGVLNRQAIAKKYEIDEGCFMSIIYHYCLTMCALAQEARHVKAKEGEYLFKSPETVNELR